jgi:hypothetical protein
MFQRLITALTAVVLGAPAWAEIRYGSVELAFFRMRDQEGRMIEYPTRGVVLPVRFERIQARPVGAPVRPRQVFATGKLEHPENVVIFRNDRGTNLFYAPFMASALDDWTTLPSGNGKWWYDITLGVHASQLNTVRIMNRQKGWSRFVAGRGAGVSAFDDLVFDVGWVFQPGQFPAGDWMYTIPIHQYWSVLNLQNNVPRVPNGIIYFAQQWRAYATNGEGAFLEGLYAPIFAGDGDPQVGTSADQFWYDHDPVPDGTYDETEVDYFGGPPNQANFLAVVRVQNVGVQEVLKPTSYVWRRGFHSGGNVGSLHNVDSNYLRGRRGVTPRITDPPLELEVEGFASTTGLTSIAIDLVSSANTAGLLQKVYFRNFATNSWVLGDTRNVTTTDQRILVAAPGNPSEYVEPGVNTVRALVTFGSSGPISQPNWTGSFDLLNWITTRP